MIAMDRCELSDLPVEMCDHCKTGAKTLGSDRQLHEGNWTETAIRFYRKSDRPGTCVCGELFARGDQIGWDEEKNWWRAEKCCG